MAYDSGGSFDDLDPGSPSDIAALAAADTPDNAPLVITAEALGAAAAMSLEPRQGSGWDAPSPSSPDLAPRQFASAADGSGSTGGSLNAWELAELGDDDDVRRTYYPRSRRADGGSFFRIVADGLRSFIGWPSARSTDADRLSDIALRAYTLHPDFCHQSTAEAATNFGHPELDGQSADDQVATLAARWRVVSATEASRLANLGRFVIEGRRGGGAGHTAVVVPGHGATVDGDYYPLVCGGGRPYRRSDGRKSAADVWTPNERGEVRYFAPR